jgi:hypothetical protein
MIVKQDILLVVQRKMMLNVRTRNCSSWVRTVDLVPSNRSARPWLLDVVPYPISQYNQWQWVIYHIRGRLGWWTRKRGWSSLVVTVTIERGSDERGKVMIVTYKSTASHLQVIHKSPTSHLPYKSVYKSPKMSKDSNPMELIIWTKLVKLTCREKIGIFTIYRVRHWFCSLLCFLSVHAKTVNHCSVFLLDFFHTDCDCDVWWVN